MSEPMTKDEEAAVREAGRLVAPDSTLSRLLATLDAERAQSAELVGRAYTRVVVALAKVARLRETLALLVKDADRTEHDSDTCSRLSCCDEAAESGEECECGDSCAECECGAQQTYRLAAAARAVLAETGGEP